MSKLVGEQLRMSRIDAFTQPTLETITLFAFGLVILVASTMVFREENPLEKTSFFLVLACLVGIADSLRRVSKVNNVLQRANAAAMRVFEVMDLPVEEGERKARRHGDAAAGSGANGQAAADAPRDAGRRKLPPMRREVRFEGV